MYHNTMVNSHNARFVDSLRRPLEGSADTRSHSDSCRSCPDRADPEVDAYRYIAIITLSMTCWDAVPFLFGDVEQIEQQQFESAVEVLAERRL